jgi:nitroimidazol reductase NimA-like FMN-containing flavoprotein (pyridoxamine 5'-phosphate oxidase superfamily)
MARPRPCSISGLAGSVLKPGPSERSGVRLVSVPKTEIDARYSDEGAVATSWDETRQVLETAELFWICTVRSDGRPHLTPLVSVWDEGSLYFCTGPEEQKFLNLQGNPHVLLVTGRNTWDNGLDVVVEGQAVQVSDEDLLRRLAEEWSAKWDGRWHYGVRDGGFDHREGLAYVFSVTPDKVLAFAKGNFSHTRHIF